MLPVDIVSGQSVARVRRGELVFVDSFESWYERERNRMITTLLLATGDVELAIEGVDEACSRAFERWDRVVVMDSPTGWVYRVAFNHARRVARRRTFEQRLWRRPVASGDVPDVAGEVWERVRELSPRQRHVVVLRHVGGLKEREIAATLGISRGTVSSTLRDAHERLGRLLDDPKE